MIVVERDDRFYVGAQAFLVEDDRELAWAEPHVRRDPDIKWVLGNFIETGRPNSNGHIFPLEDIRDGGLDSMVPKPLNMLHRQQRVVGATVAAELLYPTGDPTDALDVPYAELLSAMWKSNFPEDYAIVEQAHKEGSLYYSMECMPTQLGCPECQGMFAYKGRQHESYCDHLQSTPIAPKILSKPHFNAAALIVPPVRPGWRQADITQIAKLEELIADNLEEAEALYKAISGEFSHLDPKQWESLMAAILTMSEA